MATVLALHPGSVERHDDIPTVCMLDGKDDEAARELEIFLDRVSWASASHSARSHLFVLDPDYTDLVETDSSAMALRQVLEDLALLPEDHPARSGSGWRFVERMLTELGARSRPPSSYEQVSAVPVTVLN